MTKTLFFTLLSFCMVHQAYSQELAPCGTPNGKSPWLKEYQKDPGKYKIRSGEILHMPLSIFLVGDDNGVGTFGETKMVDALCTLHADFEGTEILFYLKDGFHYLYNSAYYEHGSVLKGAEMMFANNIENTVNNYVVKDPAGNCGYNLPYAGIALSKGCTEPSDHTWAHEIGHNLSLPHPFIGWEGGVSHDNTVNHNFNDPAPDTVLIDYTYFQDTLILDTMIIDTVIVERVDGSNCTYAADGFCDTKPDYLAQRWACNTEQLSLVEQTDPNGEKFYSDGTLFMSYAFDNCSNRFSDDQIDAMRANIIDEKSAYLDSEVIELPPVTEVTTLLYPEDGEMVPYDGVEIGWEPVENAEYYIIQLGIEPSSTVVIWDTIVTETSLVLYDLKENDDIYWRVRAFNSFHFCTEFSDNALFVTTDVSAVDMIALDDQVRLQPNYLQSGDRMYIRNSSSHSIERIEVRGVGGGIAITTSSAKDYIDTASLVSGVYFATIVLENDLRLVRKFAIL